MLPGLYHVTFLQVIYMLFTPHMAFYRSVVSHVSRDSDL